MAAPSVLALDAERVDQPTARAKLDARLGLDPAALELTLDAAETGGLLARLTGRPEAGDFTLRLSGSGPLDAWTGDLKLDAARLARRMPSSRSPSSTSRSCTWMATCGRRRACCPISWPASWASASVWR